MKLIWMSDIHLNFLKEEARMAFYHRISQQAAYGDAVLITGDIAESDLLVPMVEEMLAACSVPIYFVLGNHDYYGSSVKAVRASVKHLHHLPHHPIELNKETLLIGVDGWGDTRNGDYENSRLTMSDWLYIDDLRREYGKGMAALKKQLMKLADADARKLKRDVKKAIEQGYKRIIIATHVPPFEQACLYAGTKSTPSGLPFFSSKCLGTAILPIAEQNSDIDFLWLSGHTHSRATYKPCDNLTVKVAEAQYYHPQIEESIDV